MGPRSRSRDIDSTSRRICSRCPPSKSRSKICPMAQNADVVSTAKPSCEAPRSRRAEANNLPGSSSACCSVCSHPVQKPSSPRRSQGVPAGSSAPAAASCAGTAAAGSGTISGLAHIGQSWRPGRSVLNVLRQLGQRASTAPSSTSVARQRASESLPRRLRDAYLCGAAGTSRRAAPRDPSAANNPLRRRKMRYVYGLALAAAFVFGCSSGSKSTKTASTDQGTSGTVQGTGSTAGTQANTQGTATTSTAGTSANQTGTDTNAQGSASGSMGGQTASGSATTQQQPGQSTGSSTYGSPGSSSSSPTGQSGQSGAGTSRSGSYGTSGTGRS